MENNQKLTDSRFGVYEGLIALMWADHKLHENEKREFHQLVDNNRFMSDEQRQILHNSIDNQSTLQDVWPHITEKQDRAFLLNLADVIFHADGNYCETEQELYEEYLQKHLSTLETEKVLHEISELAMQQKAQRAKLQEDMKEYQKQFSLVAAIAKLF